MPAKHFLFIVAIAAGLAALGTANAANDWSKPCFSGECAYDLSEEASSGMYTGTFKLFGSSKSVTDITPSAGWVVLDCDPNALAQDIRLVCKTNDADSAGCSHLFDHGGPVDKIVRLPESCGAGPFARIANTQIATDQSIPAHAEPHITRRDGIPPQVHTLQVDTNYAAINEDKTGAVHFVFQGGNLPGLAEAANFQPPNQLNEEGLLDWVRQIVKEFKSTVKDVFKQVEEKIADATTVKYDNKKTLKPFGFNAPFKSLYSYNAKCNADVFKNTKQSSIKTSLDISAGGSGTITPTVGIIAAGVVSRLQVSEFGAFIKFSAELKLRLNLHAVLSGVIDSGRKEIFSQGIPPLSIPGFLELGPSFAIDGQVKGTFQVVFDADINLNWKNNDLEVWFPEKLSGPATDSVSPDDTPLTITATPSLSGKATVDVSLSPQVKLGLKIFKASADVYCAATGTASVTLEGKVTTSLKARDNLALGESMHTREEHELLNRPPPYGVAPRALALASRDQQVITAKWCFKLILELLITAGVEGSFFGFWSGRKEFAPFYKNAWEVLKIGTCASAKREEYSSLTFLALKREEKPKCPLGTAGEPEQVAKQTVKASSIKKV
ncbi:hypothetical protein HGRIS_009081 [Hohenbuehelia grisea]|uniref:Uncharacterized protein n=1 Tax=Hohenbuehelia grisea TaxID=104357 RepID=A0ABR3J097_9AGAR